MTKIKLTLLAALALSALALVGGCGAPAADTTVQTGGAPLKTTPLTPEDNAKIKANFDKKHPDG